MKLFIKVMKEGDLPPGKSAIVNVRDKEIALFNYKGKYFAVSNKCPHKGAPLGEGRIEEGVIICPNHEWRFSLESGGCPQNPELKTTVYPVRVHKGVVRIGIDADEERKPIGKEKYTVPEELKFKIPTIQKPINPDETL
ncbi:Rieske (2Fe-2S) protein [Nitrospina watsonii]|uniref:Rieske-type ferredoxin n=1 Tax=Nitrospina watsonii TaxID=1323948 RepID=A0ABM9HE16_9BACT|nr:Rieske (2Fe-2S) protein [Nitrospina watsonii]CAI2718482.1 Putative Rieske-type ferredoxin [Nitrospina watsonii]